MNKIYLASFLEPDNHGSGRKISIANTKPDYFQVSGAFEQFIPKREILETYREKQLESQVDAANLFNKEYRCQLDSFFENVKDSSDLPFEDGDTLLSWERYGNINYRTIIAKYLSDIGYDVVLR